MHTSRTLAILIFDDVELLDFCGPLEVFSVANRYADPPAFHVVTVAEKGPVNTRGGLNVNPNHGLGDCPQPELFLIPGGQGTRREMHNTALIDWIRRTSQGAELVLSVCTGALLLAKAGLLDGLEATTHHGAFDLLREVAPKTKMLEDRRFVDNGRVICSAGIAAGIDMSLHVVGRLLGREAALKTAKQMEYPWTTDDSMQAYRILFDQIEWQAPQPGVRFKAARQGSQQVRLVEFTIEFVERDWCEKGHTGLVLAGELDIDFSGDVVRFAEGSALLIPAGARHRHKARVLTPLVRLFLVEEV